METNNQNKMTKNFMNVDYSGFLLGIAALFCVIVLAQHNSVKKQQPKQEKVRKTKSVMQIHNGKGDNVGNDTARGKNTHIIQIHNGDGDNIAGSKIVEN